MCTASMATCPLHFNMLFTTSHERGGTEAMQSDGNSSVASEEVHGGHGLNLIYFPFIPATDLACSKGSPQIPVIRPNRNCTGDCGVQLLTALMRGRCLGKDR